MKLRSRVVQPPPSTPHEKSPLGEGDLPLGFLLDTLKEAGFEGPVIFELTIQEARASLDHLRPFLAERWPHLEQGDDGEQE